MKRAIAMLLVAGVSWMGFLNCVGTFALTGKLNRWVVSMRDKGGWAWKFIGWIIFLVFVFFPIYGIAIFVDAVVLNSIEFWFNSNPLAFNENGEATKVAVKGNEKAVFHYTQRGEQLEITFYKEGKLAKQLVLKKSEPGVFYSRVDGRLVPVHVETKDTPEGRSYRVFEGERQVHAGVMSSSQLAIIEGKVAEVVNAQRQYADAAPAASF